MLIFCIQASRPLAVPSLEDSQNLHPDFNQESLGHIAHHLRSQAILPGGLTGARSSRFVQRQNL